MLNFCHRLIITPLTFCLFMTISLNAPAYEALKLRELALHCKALESKPESADAQYCVRYIQGFVDGALETDERILKDVETNAMSAFTQRAMDTRMTGHGATNRFGSVAGFCFQDSVPLNEVVNKVVSDLIALDKGEKANMPARIAVDDSLRDHYPCRG